MVGVRARFAARRAVALVAVAAALLACSRRNDPLEHLDVTPTEPEPPTNPSTIPGAPVAPVPPPAGDGTPPGAADVGAWGPVLKWPVGAVHTHVLPTGKVLFGGEWLDGALPPRLWDPGTGEVTVAPYAGYNVFCSGHAFLADGQLIFAGGHIKDDYGSPRASLFDPVTGAWTQLPEMNAGRWYASATTLSTGEILVVSGEMAGVGDVNPIPQVFDAVTRTWRTLTGASRRVPFYPRQFAAPNGKVFVATPGSVSLWLDPSGQGAWEDGPQSHFGFRDYGGAVMLDGKVLITGGGDPPTRGAELIDLDDPAPAWKVIAPMHFARRQLNTTVLPDGTVLVTGGSQGPGHNNENAPVLAAEIYDPVTDAWTTLSSAAEYRGYHSTAVLLPDGRILTGGSTLKTTAQVFSPPYLFRGPRPVISTAPARIAPGTDFLLETPDASRIAKVTLVRLGSVTHAFDQNQRLVTLSFSPAAGGLDVRAPPSPLRAPPGHYMLFLVDTAGVPSTAAIVQLAG